MFVSFILTYLSVLINFSFFFVVFTSSISSYKKMAGILNDRDICKSILCQTVLIMLKAEEKDKTLEIKKLYETSVPTYVGKMIVNLVVIFFEKNPSCWHNWDHSRSRLAKKGPRNSFLFFATLHKSKASI